MGNTSFIVYYHTLKNNFSYSEGFFVDVIRDFVVF